jgi:hypothetical protein
MPSIQAVHTIGVMACVLVLAYALWRLERAFNLLAGHMRKILQEQAEIQTSIKRLWARIEQLEERVAQTEGRI